MHIIISNMQNHLTVERILVKWTSMQVDGAAYKLLIGRSDGWLMDNGTECAVHTLPYEYRGVRNTQSLHSTHRTHRTQIQIS